MANQLIGICARSGKWHTIYNETGGGGVLRPARRTIHIFAMKLARVGFFVRLEGPFTMVRNVALVMFPEWGER